MVSRGRIQKHEEGELIALITHNKKNKGKGGQSNSRKPPP